MDIKNCKKCGKVFAYNGHNVCPQCRKEEEEEFKNVKEFIYDNPGATVQMVSEETGVDVKKILRYLKEGKLEIKGDSNLILECERCGVSVNTGRFCNKCISELERELKGSMTEKVKSPSQNSRDKMYVADRHKR